MSKPKQQSKVLTLTTRNIVLEDAKNGTKAARRNSKVTRKKLKKKRECKSRGKVARSSGEEAVGKTDVRQDFKCQGLGPQQGHRHGTAPSEQKLEFLVALRRRLRAG